jgi:type I site-specific restriction-modification system R (restriction) subunit
MKFNELYTIEKHIIKFIQENLGYEFIPAEEFSKLRTFENEFIITSHLLESVQKINDIDENLALSVVREIKKLDTNEAFLLAIREGINLKDPETGKSRDYKIVDFGVLENNRFVVTNQFYNSCTFVKLFSYRYRWWWIYYYSTISKKYSSHPAT